MAAPVAAAAAKLAQSKEGRKLIKSIVMVALGIFCLIIFAFCQILAPMIKAAGDVNKATGGDPGATNSIPPMPSVAQALANPTYKLIFEAAQKAVGLPPGSTQTNARMQLLLSMAWVDSQWGTNSNATPILSGDPGMVAAQAAIAAGLDPSSQAFVYALAISHAESGWNPDIGNCNGPPDVDVYYPSAAFEACESLDVGIWQINTSPAGRDGVARDALVDPLTNAKAMMQISSNGTNWGPWCTAWSGGSCSKGTLLGCPGSSFCAYMQLAQQLAAQVSGASLGTSYTGIILMTTTEWKTLAPGVDPNSPSNADNVFQIVNNNLGTTDNTDPDNDTAPLTAFYNLGVSPPNTTTVPAHVQDIITVDQEGFGGLNGVNQTILQIAKSEVGVGTCATFWGCPFVGEWCAEFTSWVWNKAGVNIGSTPGAVGIEDWAKQNSQWLLPGSTPEPGDAIVWTLQSAPQTDGYMEHVAIIAAVQGSGSSLELQTIDGNNGTPYVGAPTPWFNPINPGFGNDDGNFTAAGYAVP